jgi:carbonic anhydrase/acetyltransferase-like protein (isoleucine patch superfamily)
MGAIVMNEAVIGDGCIIGAGSVVAPGTRVEDRTLLVGVPAKPKRAITEQDLEMIDSDAREYCELSRHYLSLSADLHR